MYKKILLYAGIVLNFAIMALLFMVQELSLKLLISVIWILSISLIYFGTQIIVMGMPAINLPSGEFILLGIVRVEDNFYNLVWVPAGTIDTEKGFKVRSTNMVRLLIDKNILTSSIFPIKVKMVGNMVTGKLKKV